MIQVNNLVKQYGSFTAVDHLSFEVKEGEILGFLGPNGAGKSTTMNILTGYLSATAGEAIINGYDIFEEPEMAKKSIGYLPEIPPLYPDMRVKEYLLFAAELKQVPRAERKEAVARVMEQAKVTHMQTKLIRHLSKGYRQRVGLAQALLGDPKIMILDEPTVGLDPMQIIEMRELIRKLGETHTVILSSHILFEVSEICDRVLIINKGKKVALDTPENIVRGLDGTEGIRLLVQATPEEARQAIAGISEITEYRIAPDPTPEGLTELTVYARIGQEIRDKVFFAFAKAGRAIFEMHTQTKSLEEIFIEVTKEEEHDGNL